MAPTTKLIAQHFQIHRTTTLRRRYLVRISIFMGLEAGFLVLAYTCLTTPVTISLPLSQTQAKTIFTVLVIIWHSIAILNARDCVLHDFSGEWYNHFRSTNKLVPGTTDGVSTLNSKILDRIKYFFAKEASTAYRISFVTWWALIALGGLAPGVIHIDNISHKTSTRVDINRYTTPGGNIEAIADAVAERGYLFTKFEQREQTIILPDTEKGFIIGNLNLGLQKSTTVETVEYETDVVLYNMSCWWEQPSFNMSAWNITWYAGGYAWYRIILCGNPVCA